MSALSTDMFDFKIVPTFGIPQPQITKELLLAQAQPHRAEMWSPADLTGDGIALTICIVERCLTNNEDGKRIPWRCRT